MQGEELTVDKQSGIKVDRNSNLINVNHENDKTLELQEIDVDEELLTETIQRNEDLSPNVTQEKPTNEHRIPNTAPMAEISAPVRHLSRSRLEQLLIEKVAGSLMLRSENTDLHARLGREERTSQVLNKRLMRVEDRYRRMKSAVEKLSKTQKKR